MNDSQTIYLVIFSRALLKLCCLGGMDGSGFGVLMVCTGAGIFSVIFVSALMRGSGAAVSLIGGRDPRPEILGENCSILATTSSTSGPGRSGGRIYKQSRSGNSSFVGCIKNS